MIDTRRPMRVRVVEAHVTSDVNPVRFHAGDTIGIGHRDQIWRRYIWGTDQAGRSGWVPEEYLAANPDGCTAVARRDYDSTELTVGRGQVLDVLDDAGGWYLCRTDAGTSDWVPGTSVEPAED